MLLQDSSRKQLSAVSCAQLGVLKQGRSSTISEGLNAEQVVAVPGPGTKGNVFGGEECSKGLAYPLRMTAPSSLAVLSSSWSG